MFFFQAEKHETRQLDEDGFIELLKSHPPKANNDTPTVPNPVTPGTKESSSQKSTPNVKPTPIQTLPKNQEKKGLTPRALSLSSQSGSPYSPSQSSQNTQSPCASKTKDGRCFRTFSLWDAY